MAGQGLQQRIAETFVAGARGAPPNLRGLAMRSPARNLVAAQIFVGMARQFDGERGADLDAVVRWEIGAEGEDPEVWELVIRDGRCRAVRDSGEQPQTTIGLDHETLLDLAVGLANAPGAYIAGRLRMRGDVMLAQRMTALFRIPGAPAPR